MNPLLAVCCCYIFPLYAALSVHHIAGLTQWETPACVEEARAEAAKKAKDAANPALAIKAFMKAEGAHMLVLYSLWCLLCCLLWAVMLRSVKWHACQ